MRHQVTGSAISREEKRGLTVVTWTCSCGESVTGKGRKLSNAERKIKVAWMLHKR